MDTEDNVIAVKGAIPGPNGGYVMVRRAGVGEGEARKKIMPSVNIIDLNNSTVGSIELSDAVFGAEVNEALLYEAVRQDTAARSPVPPPPKRVTKFGFGQEIVEAEGHRPGANGLHPIALWRQVALSTDRNRAATNTSCRARCCSVRSVRLLSAKLRDGELRVMREFELADHKTKTMVGSWDTRTKKRVLLVEAGENENLARASRNLQGVKLVPTKDVTFTICSSFRRCF